MNTLITLVFIAGYAAIVFEHPLKINKTASALLTASTMAAAICVLFLVAVE